MSDLAARTVIGIAAEFDPFHEGHRYLIDQAASGLSVEGVVAVMSGHFVQRGQPAVFDKWKRAEDAVKVVAAVEAMEAKIAAAKETMAACPARKREILRRHGVVI